MPHRYDTNPHAKWKKGKSYADCLRRYPMGPGANPLTNDYRKRSASNQGGASIGGGSAGS